MSDFLTNQRKSTSQCWQQPNMRHSRFSPGALFVFYNIIFLSGNLCTQIQLISERGYAWHLSWHASRNRKIVLVGLEYKPCKHEAPRSRPQNVGEDWMLSMGVCSPDALVGRCGGDRMDVGSWQAVWCAVCSEKQQRPSFSNKAEAKALHLKLSSDFYDGTDGPA